MNASAEPLVLLRRAARTYGRGPAAVVALQQTDGEVWPGARIALTGPSGSGKSTLLHLMAGLDSPTVGEVSWPALGPPEALRPGPVAVVFQGASLLPPLTVLENVALPLVLAGETDADARVAGARSLGVLGLEDLADKLPEEISGGQLQRAAIARALAGRPRLVLADEPTGQLDRVTGAEVVDVLMAAADHAGAALVVATHDLAIADRLAERWELHDGRVVRGPERSPAWSR